MYTIIRLLFGFIFLTCAVVAIRKSKIIRKTLMYVIFTVISIALITISALVPVENLFITFNSPQSAYNYINFGKSDIDLIIEGENCDFVVDRKNDTDTYIFIPKTETGWKIGTGVNTKERLHAFYDGIMLKVYQYKDTNDFFVTIFNIDGGYMEITDCYNSKIFSLEKENDSLGKTYVTYYTHLTEINPQYYMIINGEKVSLIE